MSLAFFFAFFFFFILEGAGGGGGIVCFCFFERGGRDLLQPASAAVC